MKACPALWIPRASFSRPIPAKPFPSCARGVRWIIADETFRVVSTSAALLGVPFPTAEPFGSTLEQRPKSVPPWLEHADYIAGVFSAGKAEFYRLYRVDDAKLPP